MAGVKTELRSAVAALNHCTCNEASARFEEAAREAMLAQHAPTRDLFDQSYNTLVRLYADGIDKVRTCMQDPQRVSGGQPVKPRQIDALTASAASDATISEPPIAN